MATELIINATLPETRIALLENGEIQELHIERDSERGIVGNIYKGKVIRVLPGMQAAFVDIGLEKAAFLYVDDIFFPDMRTPLTTHPLPEAAPKPAAPTAAPTSGEKEGGRGRGGGRRPGRGAESSQKPGEQPLPGSPEEHAMMQREYARQMLDTETEAEAVGVAKAEAPAVEATGVAASASPADLAAPTGQPEARALQPEIEEEEDEIESEAVYRPEPLIDAAAWAEDLAHQQEMQAEESAEHAAAPAAPETGEPQAPSAEADATGAEPVEAATSEAAAEEGAPCGLSPQARVSVPPVAPLAAPVTPVGVDEDDEEDVAEMPRRRRRRESVNIADIIKEGQEILVQVAKDPIGTKGARLTCHVSLPGRYLVFMPTVDHIGVSRRIESEGERRRLKETMGKIRPAKTGVIVRTASGKQTDRKLKQDLDYLVTTWNDIQKKFNKQRTPSAVYQDLTIVLRAIRDMFTDEVDKVVVDSRREHKAIMKFVTRFIPQVKDKVDQYTGDMPIFDYYGIETEISKALERKVWLKSGGYLVVDQAEALVAIDVNTGRYVGKKTLEETILKTNLEAVKEIAYQLRIRNAGGIIILDLIDMEKEGNREKVYKALEEALKKDRARPSILKISQLGLIEMTRKRTRDSMVRSLCEPCSYCEGKGFVKNKLTITYDIMRDLEREGVVRETNAISIQCHPSVADVLVEDKRDVIEALEHQFNKKITIRGNGAYHVEQYELVAHRDNKNVVWSSEERRQILRQKINERMQAISAEQRKVAESERQGKKREADERRKEQERLRAERRAQAEERRKQAQAARAAEREARRAAFLAERGLEPNSPEAAAALAELDRAAAPAPAPAPVVIPEFDESQPFLNADGSPMAPEQIDELRAKHAAMVAAAQSQAQAQAGEGGFDRGSRDGGRRRRRGRRGRGGRSRGPNGPHPRQQAQGSPGEGGRSSLPRPNTGDVGPGGETYTAPSAEHLGPRELAGSASEDGDGDAGSEGAPGAREGQADNREGHPDAQRRRRRRGRRGGRRRRRFGQGGPVGASEGGGGVREASLSAASGGGSGGGGSHGTGDGE